MIGETYDRLTVLERVGSTPAKKRTFLCRCECGRSVIVVGSKLISGHTRSCGCLHKDQLVERNTKHGDYRSPTHTSWAEMHRRCSNPNFRDWKHYGGRGIKVSPAWSDYSKFLDDMGSRPKGKTLDRIDVDGNYEIGNCRWATSLEQRRNRRDGK